MNDERSNLKNTNTPTATTTENAKQLWIQPDITTLTVNLQTEGAIQAGSGPQPVG